MISYCFNRIVYIVLVSICFPGVIPAQIPANERIEVVPASHAANVVTEIDGWKTEWISEKQGIAVTTDVMVPERFRAQGLLHVWSLHTGRVQRTVEVPATVQVIAGDGDSPIVVVAGGPYNKNEDSPFVWIINLQTGEVVQKLVSWPDDGPGGEVAAHVIRDGALTREPNKFVLRFREACALYDLSQPKQAPAMLAESEWERLVPQSKGFRNVPNWLKAVGPSDGSLTIGRTSEGVGVWRNDTWEQIMPLGTRKNAQLLWVPAPDSSVLLAIRLEEGSEKAPHQIWNFNDFEITEWVEPGLSAQVTPAFVNGGRLLRFAREIKGQRVEFVSRDCRTGEEHIDHVLKLPKMASDSWYELNATYSDDGSVLVLGSSEEMVILRWKGNELTAPTREVSHLRASRIGGVSCDGRSIYYLPNQQGDDFESREGRVWDVATKRSTKIRALKTLGHPPEFSFQSVPGVDGEVFAYRATGSSAGPYGFGLQTRRGGRGAWVTWPENEMRLLEGASFVRPSGSSNAESVLVAWFDSALRSYDATTGRMLDQIERNDIWPHGVRRRIAAPLAGRVFLGLDNGGVQIIDVQANGQLKPVAQLWSPKAGSWLAILPDGRYAVSPITQPPVYFRRAGKLHPIEDYDARLNQPGKVAETLGATPAVVERLRAQREKRLRRLGITDIAPATDSAAPSLTISQRPPLRHDMERLRIEGDVKPGANPVTELELHVNDVPVYGISGLALDQEARASGRFRIEVPLSAGSNKVQLAARDVTGAVSGRELFHVHRSATGATPRRHVLTIGVADYDDDSLDLTYASKDAADIAAALTRVAGHTHEPRTLILSDKKARRADILAAREFLQQSKPEDQVIVFVSGHGVVDEKGDYFFCPADFQSEGCRNGVSYSDLEGLLDGIPALNRLLLVDSCHSGELTDEQARDMEIKYAARLASNGVKVRAPRSALGTSAKGENVPVANRNTLRAANELFLDLRRTTGATVLSASGGLEFALEDAEQKNGVFTHSIIKVLERGSNTNGELTASQLARDVATTVERLTEGQQHPNARFINLATDFPIRPDSRVRPPGRPEDVVRYFVEWSAINFNTAPIDPSAGGSLHPRLMNCFAPQVAYFGKNKTVAAIEAEERAYQRRFGIRNHEMKDIIAGNPLANGETPVRYKLEYQHGAWLDAGEAARILAQQARKKASGWSDGGAWKNGPDGRVSERLLFRTGTLSMEAFVRQIGHEWKIISLRTASK